MTPILLIQIFLISFLVNLLWEVLHSRLYKTCLEMEFSKFPTLITIMSLKDGFWITLFYAVSILIFKQIEILNNYPELSFFIILVLIFSFIDEKISLKKARWEYSQQMPIIFGVGVTPLLELAITGIISFAIIFYLF